MPARHDFEAHLRAGPAQGLMPVYAIVGTSALLRQDALAALRARAITAAAAFNCDEFEAGADSGTAAVAAARQLPVMAERRFVHLRQVHKLTAKQQAPLLAYLTAPSPTTVLCLSGDKLDLRLKLGQALTRGKYLFALEPPRPAELPGWVTRRAAGRDISLDSEAAALLVELTGGDLDLLMSNLEKVALYAGGGEKVTAEHVGEAVAATRVSSIFELTDAVGRRDWASAGTLLRNIVQGGESALLVLTMLVRQLRQLVQVKALAGQRSSPAAVAQALGVRPFAVDVLRTQARNFEPEFLHAALAAAARTDIALKSSRLPALLLLERLVLTIIGGPVR